MLHMENHLVWIVLVVTFSDIAVPNGKEILTKQVILFLIIIG